MSRRSTILAAVTTALDGIASYTLVPPGTTDEISSASLPALVVGFASEAVTHEMHGGTQRQLDITIAAVVKSRGDVYAALDDAAGAIEAALTDETLGGTCDLFLLSQTQFALDQEQPLGEVRLTYSATYTTDPIS